MTNETFYSHQDFYARELMGPPKIAAQFGPKAFVYSEIKARVMVIDAYERGLRDANSGVEPSPGGMRSPPLKPSTPADSGQNNANSNDS